MATRKDPRTVGGRIAGPGGPFEKGAVIFDVTDAVLLDHAEVAMVDTVRDGQIVGYGAMALKLSGRVNKSPDRAEILFLFDAQGAGTIVANILGAAMRAIDLTPLYAAAVAQAIEELPTE